MPTASASFWPSVCPVTSGCAAAHAALLRLAKKLMKPQLTPAATDGTDPAACASEEVRSILTAVPRLGQ
jgi:hypothetical protein